jgi:hypothetical protein
MPEQATILRAMSVICCRSDSAPSRVGPEYGFLGDAAAERQ